MQTFGVRYEATPQHLRRLPGFQRRRNHPQHGPHRPAGPPSGDRRLRNHRRQRREPRLYRGRPGGTGEPLPGTPGDPPRPEPGLRRGAAHRLRRRHQRGVFYTDGDAQYNPLELVNLVEALRDGVDVVNGYKVSRNDPLIRKIVGRLYHYFVKYTFGFKLRDVDCDFRLIRRAIFDQIPLESDSGTICLEMVKKFQDAGYVFAEVPVHHYHRQYGVSQFWNWRRLFRTARQLAALWWKLVVRKEHLRRRTGQAGAQVEVPMDLLEMEARR